MSKSAQTDSNEQENASEAKIKLKCDKKGTLRQVGNKLYSEDGKMSEQKSI